MFKLWNLNLLFHKYVLWDHGCILSIFRFKPIFEGKRMMSMEFVTSRNKRCKNRSWNEKVVTRQNYNVKFGNPLRWACFDILIITWAVVIGIWRFWWRWKSYSKSYKVHVDNFTKFWSSRTLGTERTIAAAMGLRPIWVIAFS